MMVAFSRKLLLSITAVLLLLLVLYELHAQERESHLKTPMESSIAKDLSESDLFIRVLLVFSGVAGKSQLQSNFKDCVQSMMHTSSKKVELNIAGDTQSQEIATGILNGLSEPENENLKLFVDRCNRTFFQEELERRVLSATRFVNYSLPVIFHEMQPLEKKVEVLLSDRIQSFRSSKSSYYGSSFFFLSMILHEMFPKWSKVVVLDIDTKFMKDISVLWNYFLAFKEEQVIGIGYEMSPVYRKIFSTFKKKNPETKIGEPLPSGFPGFNSGVILLDLVKIRKNQDYLKYQTKEEIDGLVKKYEFQGHLGDQDFYTLVGAEDRRFFYSLPCQWNRQLCRYWQDKGFKDVFQLYFACKDPIFLMHGNCHTSIPKNNLSPRE